MKFTLTIDALALQLASTSDTLKNLAFSNEYIISKYALKGNVYEINKGLLLRKVQKLEKYYMYSFEVWADNVYVANLSTNCRQYGKAGSIKLEFQNSVFYSRPGWLHYLRQIEQHLPLSFVSVSYLEIAFDFQAATALLPQLSNMYRHSTFIQHNPNPQFGPMRGQLHCSLLSGKTYVFGAGVKGKDASGKQVVVYNKTTEIIEKSGKDYINDYYRANGFDMSLDVERVEVKLSSKYMSKHLIYLEDLTNFDTMGNIFRVSVGDTFKFRLLGSVTYDANRNKKTATVALIEFQQFSDAPLYLKPVYANDDATDNRKRTEAKTVVWRYVTYGKSQDLDHLDYIRTDVKAPGGSDWTCLFRKYAHEFHGTPTPERMARIDYFS
ncbi:hypothetical protein GCM10027511_09000 [Hymenobacter humi]